MLTTIQHSCTYSHIDVHTTYAHRNGLPSFVKKPVKNREVFRWILNSRQNGEILHTGRQQIPDSWSDEAERAPTKMFWCSGMKRICLPQLCWCVSGEGVFFQLIGLCLRVEIRELQKSRLNPGTVSKAMWGGSFWETGWVHMGFCKCVDTILSWTRIHVIRLLHIWWITHSQP